MADVQPASGLRSAWTWIRALAGPVSGIAFFMLTLVSSGLGSPFQGSIRTSPDESGRVTATVLTRNAADVDTASQVAIVGVFFLFWFVGYLYRWLSRDDGADGWMAPTALAAGIATAALIAVNVQFDLATTLTDDYGEDFAAARAVALLAWTTHMTTGAAMAAMILATSLAVLGSQREVTLPRWTAWVGLPVALIVFLLSPWERYLLFMVWVLIISATMAWKIFDTPTVASHEDKDRPLIYGRRM